MNYVYTTVHSPYTRRGGFSAVIIIIKRSDTQSLCIVLLSLSFQYAYFLNVCLHLLLLRRIATMTLILCVY